MICKLLIEVVNLFVGATGFEPTTSTSRTWRATGLRYAPKKKNSKLSIKFIKVHWAKFKGVQLF